MPLGDTIHAFWADTSGNLWHWALRGSEVILKEVLGRCSSPPRASVAEGDTVAVAAPGFGAALFTEGEPLLETLAVNHYSSSQCHVSWDSVYPRGYSSSLIPRGRTAIAWDTSEINDEVRLAWGKRGGTGEGSPAPKLLVLPGESADGRLLLKGSFELKGNIERRVRIERGGVYVVEVEGVGRFKVALP